MSLKLNGATSGSIELDVPDAIGSDLSLTLPATAGEVAIKGTDGSVDLGDVNIDSSGRLLVGTSSYSGNSAFVVKGGASQNVGLVDIRYGATRPTGAGTQVSEVRFGSTDLTSNTSYANIQCFTDGDSTSDSDTPGRLVFSTTADGASSPTERMRVNAAGRFFIGTDFHPSYSSTTRATIAFTGLGAEYGMHMTALSGLNTNTRWIEFADHIQVRGSIDWSGSAVRYNTSSDYRLKENITSLSNGISRLKQLNPCKFNFIENPDSVVDGFIAHEVQSVVPEAVTGSYNEVKVWTESEELPDGVSVGDNKLDEDGNTIPVYQGIDQSKLVPLLTAALQEAIAKIETLEAKVAALEANP